MSIKGAKRTNASADSRRRALLDTALEVFTRYGYQKTSMDEVARSAQLSRQGLYLHFATKEELFRAAVRNALENSSGAAVAALTSTSLPLDQRLVRAFDEWLGRYIGIMGGDASDLIEATSRLSGTLLSQYEEVFSDAVTKAIRSSRLLAACKHSGITARQITDTLQATAHGLKNSSKSREQFVRRFAVAVKVLCSPIQESS
jgi:TetR/AcrR family transcriptional regulator, regulator of autoinduction and epiphytic fitness